MSDFNVPWGQGELMFTLPENWTVEQIAAPTLRPAPPDWTDRVALALSQPDVGLPLEKLLAARSKGRIVLVVEDATRHSPLPQLLDLVMREIRHAKIDDSQVEIVIATGMHPPMTPDQVREKLGPLADEIRWRCNPWRDKKAYVCIGEVNRLDIELDRGVATADLRILISSVSPHLQAGFGGGYKMLFPGCASLETIRLLHRQGLGRAATQLVGADSARNAMRQVIDAAGSLADEYHGKSFSLQYVLDDHDLPSFVTAGDVLPVQQMMAKQCALACGIVTPQMADVLIASAHPRDFDLWQSFKCIANTLWAARPGGVVICLTRCLGGANGVRPIPWPLSPAGTRKLVRLLGPEALTSLLIRLVPRLAGDAFFFIRMALQATNRNWIFMVSPALCAAGVKFPGVRLFTNVEQAVAAAQEVLGTGPQRVAIFPSGGITFPVLPQRPVSGDRE